MSKEYRAKVFKSGNSLALRLPKALGLKEGTEMLVHEEQGSFRFEPVKEEPRYIDLTGIAGSMPWLKPIIRNEEYEDIPREWHLLGLKAP